MGQGDTIDSVATVLALAYGYKSYGILERYPNKPDLKEAIPVFNIPINEIKKRKDIMAFLNINSIQPENLIFR